MCTFLISFLRFPCYPLLCWVSTLKYTQGQMHLVFTLFQWTYIMLFLFILWSVTYTNIQKRLFHFWESKVISVYMAGSNLELTWYKVSFLYSARKYQSLWEWLSCSIFFFFYWKLLRLFVRLSQSSPNPLYLFFYIIPSHVITYLLTLLTNTPYLAHNS